MSGSRQGKNFQIPSWFKLDKYDKQAVLDLPGWLLQFGVRRDILRFINAHYVESSDPLKDAMCSQLIDLIHRDPILQWDHFLKKYPQPAIQLLFPSLAPLHSLHPRNEMAVHPTTTEELFRFELSLHPVPRDNAMGLYAQILSDVEAEEDSPSFFNELDVRLKFRKCDPSLEADHHAEEKVPYDPMMSQPLYCSSERTERNILFTVDVSLPDKLLVAQFRDSVQRARNYFSKAVDMSTHLPTNQPVNWTNEQLLAYFDLSLEEYLPHGVPLSQSKIAELIWPNRPGKATDKNWDVDHLTSTTSPLVEEMMAEYSAAFWVLQASVAAILAKPSLDAEPSATITPCFQRPKTRRNRWRK